MDLLKKGQKLTIAFEKEDKFVEMTCEISNIFNDRIVLELPQYFMRYIEFLEVGNKLTIKAFSKIGTIDFNTIIISSPLEEEFSVEFDNNAIKLTPSEDIPHIDAIETLNIKIDEMVFKVSTFEISTENLKFNSSYKFNLEDSFDCELILPNDYGIIRFRGTIIEVDPVYDTEYKTSYSIMSEEDRRALLYYMYFYSNNSD